MAVRSSDAQRRIAIIGTGFSGLCMAIHLKKAGIDSFTRTCANEWGIHGIRSNGIAPGPIGDTEGMRRLAPTKNEKDHAKLSVPLQRWGTKREIADACVFLVSDASKFTTGTIIVIDGGSWIYRGGVGGSEVGED